MELCHCHEGMVGIAEMRHKRETMGRRDSGALVGIGCSAVVVGVRPSCRHKAGWIERVVIFVEDVEEDLPFILQLGLLVAGAQEIVDELKFWLNLIGRFIILCLMCQCHRVDIAILVFLQFGRSGAEHVVVVGQVIAIDVLLVDGEVRHLLIGDGVQFRVVLMIVSVGHVEVGDNLDAVAHKIVESHTGGEAVEFLLYDGTRLVVVTSC